MERCLIYIRFSPRPYCADPDEVDSLAVQLERCRAYCRISKLDIANTFSDQLVTGTIPLTDREGGRALLTALRNGGIQHVVVQKLDRLFRNTEEALGQVRAWDAAGVTLHLADQGGCSINVGTATGKFIFTVLAGVATYERDTTSERTSLTMRHQARNGKRVSSQPTFGWTEGPDGAWVEDSDEQAAVGLIHRLHAQRFSLRAIGRKLEAEGILCRGHRWHHSLIKSILNRDVPHGRPVAKRERMLAKCG